ncbi:MAG: FtsQ-type POTRA domain-containing protein, partial [Candidatus Methylomirabilis sp.]|nr:FtsQ-type POTRA domain-containing protein [Deltaproteobacteria bacterium]
MAELRAEPLSKPSADGSTSSEGRASARRRMRRPRVHRSVRVSGPSSAPAGRKFSLLLFFAIAQGLFLMSPLFRLSEVEVAGNDRLSDRKILEQADLAPGSYLWALSPTGIENRLMELRELKSASVGLAMPGRVVLNVRERDPVMLVSSKGQPGRWYEADTEGVILGPVRAGSAGLPRLLLPAAVPASRKIDPTPVLVALKARTWVEESLPGKVRSYEVDDLQSVSVGTEFLGTPIVVRVGTLQSMDYKMHILRAILDRLTSEKRKVASVDLRFSSPVVKPLVP